MRVGTACIASFLSVLFGVQSAFVPSAGAQEQPPQDLRSKVEAAERDSVAGRSPEHLYRMASAYAALAESGGDAWDARLALVYFERYLATLRQKPTREQVAAMERLRALAGWRGQGFQSTPSAPHVMHFLAYDRDNTYTVRVGNQECVTPCALPLEPGIKTLETSGDGTIEEEIVVPAVPSVMRLQHHDNGMRIAGGVLIPVGALMAGLMWMLAFTCEPGPDECAVGHLIAWPVLGGSTLITGIALVAAAPSAPPPNANRVEIIGARTPSLPVPGFHMRF